MKDQILSGAAGFAALLLATTANAAPSEGGCNAIGKANFVCLSESAEDIVALPKSDWVVISGTLRAVNTKTYAEVELFPSENKLNKAVYASCPGPIDGKEAEQKKIRAGGINIRHAANGTDTLYVLHGGGGKGSVEVFDIKNGAKAPTLTWIGCAPYPEGVGFNSVAFLPNDGIVGTSFLPRSFGGYRGDKGKVAREKLTAGENVSDLWEWTPGKGWYKIPGSEGSGLNGIEASPDGKWIYANEWATGKVSRYSNPAPGQTSTKEVIATVDFHPDNLRWQPDGTLLVAGQSGSVEDVLQTCLTTNDCSKNASNVVLVDPNTKKVRKLVEKYPANLSFEISTGGMVVGKEVWVSGIGSHTKRLARFPIQ
jgi:hypothetical protein